MKDFENELDEIRIKLYEETKDLDTVDIINKVNSHAQKIANEFGFKICTTIDEIYYQVVNV
ncbi:MAG: hypothetical protein FWF22_04390 [Treponema sp.]|nr:hypothetical protein [Treponema sp.]